MPTNNDMANNTKKAETALFDKMFFAVCFKLDPPLHIALYFEKIISAASFTLDGVSMFPNTYRAAVFLCLCRIRCLLNNVLVHILRITLLDTLVFVNSDNRIISRDICNILQHFVFQQ